MAHPIRFDEELVRRTLIEELLSILPECSIATLANLATLARREADPVVPGRFRGALHHETYAGKPTIGQRRAAGEDIES